MPQNGLLLRLKPLDMKSFSKLCRLVVFASSTIVAGCASGTIPAEPPPVKLSQDAEPGEVDCKRLTGRMQVRILEYRDYANHSKSSSISRGLQSAVTSIFGGNKSEADPQAQYALVKQQLERDNQRLAAMGCRTFDIDRELQLNDEGPTPKPRKN